MWLFIEYPYLLIKKLERRYADPSIRGTARGEHRMRGSYEGEYVQRTYTAEQVAQILGISLRKAYGLCETTTQFKVMRLGKRCLRIHKESFDKWLNEQAELT